MSNILLARKAALEAEASVEVTLTKAIEQLHYFNTRLVELYGEIKKAQPVANGSICLELYLCGKSCTGCPHGRWVQYYWKKNVDESKPSRLIAVNLGARKKDPVLALSRGEHFSATAPLIREAKTILKKRARLIELVGPLRRL